MFSRYLGRKRLLISLMNRNISLLALIDPESEISNYAKINRYSKIINSLVGDYSYIGPNTTIVNVSIGKYCSIAADVIIGPSKHPINYLSTSPLFFSPANGTGIQWAKKRTYDDSPNQTKVENDVWIGSRAIIMDNLTLGNGCIVAANAVVTKDVPPYAIVGGIPAKVLKKRFNDVVIEKLQNSKWWNLPPEYLRKNVEKLAIPLDESVLEIVCNLHDSLTNED